MMSNIALHFPLWWLLNTSHPVTRVTFTIIIYTYHDCIASHVSVCYVGAMQYEETLLVDRHMHCTVTHTHTHTPVL